MAIMKTSAIVGAISGDLGGVNFVNAEAGQVVRPARRVVATHSEQQQRQQSRLAAAVMAWHKLQPEIRRAWRQFAEQWKRKNRLGVDSPIMGYSLFLMHALDVHGGTPPANFQPPAVVRHIGPTDVTVTGLGPEDIDVTQHGPPIDTNGADITARVWMERFGGQSQVSAWNKARKIADIENPPETIALVPLLDNHDIELLPRERIGIGIAWRWCDNTFGHTVWAAHTVVSP